MRLAGRIEERASAHLQSALYAITSSSVDVQETQADGYARVTCSLPGEGRCIAWKIEGSKLFPFLKSNEAADGALLVERPDGDFEAHIIECKRKVTQDSWSKAKQQIRWTAVRLLALAGVLGVRIVRWVCYTAYREDDLSPGSGRNLGLVKLPLASPAERSMNEAGSVLREQFDWEDERIALRGFDAAIPHRKVELDPAAEATLHLG
jgi:hypothetical protein